MFFNRVEPDVSGVAVAPAAALLQGGVWSGELRVFAASFGTVLLATDPAGAFGASNPFSIAATPDADNDRLPDFWENANGLASNQASGAHGAAGDIDGDGISNFLEYALNLDPQRFDLQGTPVAAVVKNATDGKDYLEITYRRRIGSSGLDYVVETASAVSAWTPDPTQYQQIGLPTPVGDGVTETVTVRVLPAAGTPGTPARFGRVRIIAP